eukprot:jgi/Psemu1/244263/estExt_Genewise1.C_4430009
MLQRFCLKPNYSLRRQLVAGYGILVFYVTFTVVLMSTLLARRAGSGVKQKSNELFQTQLDGILRETGILTGDILDKKLNGLRGTVSLLSEIVRDRIVGYPNNGWENDIHVPFLDRDTGGNVYPLHADLLPRDWMIESNLDWNNTERLRENVQERADCGKIFFNNFLKDSNTESAMFFYQGNCDPKQTDSRQTGYYPFCNEEFNDASIGGKINPTSTLALLEQKAADLGVFLKAIYEAEPTALTLAIIFSNSGAGASVIYPAQPFSFNAQYTSAGCEWMRATNALTGKPYGKEEEINRCTPEGTRASAREYNGLERAWCSDQALHPGEARIYGPYADATRASWRLTFGKAVFDRLTNEFIGCIALDVSLIQAEKLLREINEGIPSNMVLTKPDGTVVVGDVSNQTETDLTPKLWETSFIDQKTYNKLTDNLAFWEDVWDIETAMSTYDFTVKNNGKYYTVFPSPIPPDEYAPSYKPDFLIFGSINAEVQDAMLDEIDESIERDVTQMITVTIALGAIALCCMLTLVSVVAHVLTQPLKWIESTAWEIVNHTDTRADNSFTVSSDNNGNNQYSFFSFVPQTEVRELVSVFRCMICGFSGDGASQVAVPRHTETKNIVTWKDEFRGFYTLSSNQESEINEQRNAMARSVSRRMSNSARRSIPKVDTSAFAKILNDSETFEDCQEEDRPSFQSVEVSGKFSMEKSSPLKMSSAIEAAISEQEQRTEEDSELLLKSCPRTNLGSNITYSVDKRKLPPAAEATQLSKSPLFWNLFCCIVLPLLLFNSVVSIITGRQLLGVFPEWISQAQSASFDLEREHLQSSLNLIAKHVEQVFEEPLRDLHVISRMSGWLLFGAVNRSDSFTDSEMNFVEECKFYENTQECPFESNNTRSPCACEWNDPWDRTCEIESSHNWTSGSDPRYMQKLWYVNQIRNASEVYPAVDFSPESTSWYTEPDQMQGSNEGNSAKGYLTMYERLRVSSALSTVIFPIYNHGSDARANEPPASAISGYIAFDADGAYYGYSGCNYDAARYSQFQSSDSNKASKVRPDLCPLGKFGYDPRCRPWYDNTKKLALDQDDAVYIAPPYKFATVDEIGNTAVSALIDPKTGEFVGSTLIDFSTPHIGNIVKKSKAQAYAVIIPNSTDGQNMVAWSEYMDKSTPQPIVDLLMHHNFLNSTNVDNFKKIVEDMENEGEGASCDLYRTSENGLLRQFCFVYAPLYHRELRPAKSDDFGRGATASIEFLYSMILIQERSELSAEFIQRSQAIDQELENAANIFFIVTLALTILFVIVAATISSSVTRSMIQLLQTVKQVNKGGIEDDMPPLTGGSREVHQVYTSFAKLYKIVRMSNVVFFGGDLELAHHIAIDALELFRKIGDAKAIAIANNNVGNALLVRTVEYREPGSCLMFDDDHCTCCATTSVIRYYNEAVASGTNDFENASGDASKCVFAQQLADRHFNRAMGLLLTADDPCASPDAKEMALDDLFLARQYDQGVKEYMLYTKTLLKNSDVIFERSLRRLNGLAALIDIDPDVWDIWDIYELADQSDAMLRAAWDQDDAPIFRNVKKAGRLQQLEGAVTCIELNSGKGNDALPLATRMLIEDEFLLDSAFIKSADCVLQYFRDEDLGNEATDREENSHHITDRRTLYPRLGWTEPSLTKLRQEFKGMRKQGIRNALDVGRSFVVCIELEGHWNGRPLLSHLQNACLAFYEKNCRANDSLGMVTFLPRNGSLRRLSPSKRADSEAKHRDEIVAATTGVACSRFVPALQGAIDMALEVEASTSSDVYLLYVSDGGAYDPFTYQRLCRTLEERSRSGSSSSPLSSSIDLFVLGLAVQGNNRASTSSESESFVESCERLAVATHSRTSIFLDVDPECPDDAFREAAAAIHSGISFAGMRLQQALTMQKF